MPEPNDIPESVSGAIDEALRVVGRLERTLEEQNLEQARAMVVELRATAGASGLSSLGDAADEVLRVVDQTDSIEVWLEQLEQVSRLCRNLAEGRDR